MSESGARIVSIHQPNHLPWLGYFAKIRLSDVFVLHDDVEFTKRGPTRRTRIRRERGSPETAWLGVPLRRHPDHALIRDLRIDHDQDWARRHRNRVANTYGGAPRFEETFASFSSWLDRAGEFDRLADLNAFLLREVMALLGLETPLHRSSDLPVTGEKSAYNVALVRHLGGDVYLSGRGGANYQDPEEFAGAGIRLAYLDAFPWLEANPYPQAEGEFLNGLSILDALANLGAAGTRALLSRIPVSDA